LKLFNELGKGGLKRSNARGKFMYDIVDTLLTMLVNATPSTTIKDKKDIKILE
jgi:hypothetical protein